MSYKPHRDHRFEYATDAINFIEERQCATCVFKEDEEEYPMCYEFSGEILLEHTVEEIDDLGDEGLICRKYEAINE